LKGGESGPAAVPGKPQESLIVQAVRYVEEPRMPPSGKLPEAEIAALTRWVEIGLPWPDRSEAATPPTQSGGATADPEEARRFWSFQPVRDVPPPPVKDGSWPRSGLDRFILSALEAKGLRPAPEADRRAFVRRASYDLTGLPPTPEEGEAFVGDPRPDAHERLIDRLLASPRYGERWARHWLDLVRFTDSFDARIAGTNNEMDINDSWRYRDWVVDAFNRDLPYDRFLSEQIAGDLLAPETPGGFDPGPTIATGFLAVGNWGGGDADKEKLLTDIADDQVDAVSRAFLGLTMACARCHDHKFDPITTKDYYGLAGIFFSTHILANVGPKTNGPPMLRIPLAPRAEVDRREQHARRLAELQKKANEPQSKGEIERLKREAPPPIPYANGAQEGGVPGSPHAGVHDVRVHIRGSYARLGDLVPRRFPVVLAGTSQPLITSGSGRQELAHWLSRPDHPLTARVMVNRIWQHHFGAGIVRTPSNFGKLGERPTHPELLDHLARLFVESGWSVKAMHRAIMLSATYRQSCEGDPAAEQADPDNRLFGRMNRRRLDAEGVRDSLLAESGRLDPRAGGPSTRDPSSTRRALYLMTIRSDRSSFGALFDAADPTAMVEARVVSTVAPQALYLLNNAFVLEQSRALAWRLAAEAPGGGDARIRRAYALLFGRPPTDDELSIGRESLARFASERPDDPCVEAAWGAYCHVLLCTNEWIYTD
jgi:hypothetical protein